MSMRPREQTFEQGIAAQRRGDLAGAEARFGEVLERSPRHAGALTQLGLIRQWESERYATKHAKIRMSPSG